MQGALRTLLVDPEIAGVASAASPGGVTAMMLGWSAAVTVGMAFGSGLLALFAGRASTLALVLSGVGVGGFCSAVTYCWPWPPRT